MAVITASSSSASTAVAYRDRFELDFLAAKGLLLD